VVVPSPTSIAIAALRIGYCSEQSSIAALWSCRRSGCTRHYPYIVTWCRHHPPSTNRLPRLTSPRASGDPTSTIARQLASARSGNIAPIAPSCAAIGDSRFHRTPSP
ncbi:hypothetical protein B296_00018279, partial [Ensete ventricosum]